MSTVNTDYIRIAIVIPSYLETLALPSLLRELSLNLTSEDVVIVVDDSPSAESKMIETKCRESLGRSSNQLLFVNRGIKSGRGHAVRDGMLMALEKFKNLQYLIECDADGSHRVKDIIKLRDSEQSVDLLIGSRYLAGSKIQGWPISRRVFSAVLNFIIPRMLAIKISDITNGLRRYSVTAMTEILAAPQQNSGFIYLTEQALLVHQLKLSIAETPIIFINRIEGKSTVTFHEIIQSIRGVKGIILNKWR